MSNKNRELIEVKNNKEVTVLNRVQRRALQKLTKLKEFVARVFVVGGIIILSFTGIQKHNEVEARQQYVQQQQQIQQENRVEIDFQKAIMEQKITNADNLIEAISNEVEFILLTTKGHMTVEHDFAGDKMFDWLNGSKMQVTLNYNAIYSLPVSSINVTSDINGMVYVNYDKNDIQLKSLDITSHDFSEDRGWLGHKYTKEELVSLIEITQSKIRTKLNNREDFKEKASKNFEEAITCLAKSTQAYSVCFNGKTSVITTPRYTFEDVSNVKYGYNAEKKIQKIEYIVIHSTSNPNADVQAHINYYNSDPKANAVHFLVGSEEIAQTLNLNQQGWGTKGIYDDTQERSPITNANSIHLEIMEYTDLAKQKQAIENAEQFVRDVLLPQLRQQGINPKVVSHQDAQHKHCPRILLDNKVGITWKDFIDFVNGVN